MLNIIDDNTNRRVYTTFSVLIVVGLLLVPLLSYQAAASGSDSKDGKVAAYQSPIVDAAQKVGSAVCRIEVRKTVATKSPRAYPDPFFRYFFDSPHKEQRTVQALGSGFAISWKAQKYILTNQHIISEATEIRLSFPSGQRFLAKVIGSDQRIDIAVLKIKKSINGASVKKIPTVQLGDSSQAVVGQWVVAIGNPKGLDNTVTAGVLSAKNRAIPKPTGGGQYVDLLQTDAAINPGNSGGPLVNAEGKVIGINTAILRRSQSGLPLTGLNFAVAIDSVKQVLPELIKSGSVQRAALGVYIQNLTPKLRSKFDVTSDRGVLVAEVMNGSPADEAGIKSGDIILSVNGENVNSSTELQQKIMYQPVGSKVHIKLLRNEKVKVFTAVLESRSSTLEEEQTQQETLTSETYGFTLRENTSKIAQQLGLPTDKGLVITQLSPSGRASSELATGDVILSVEQRPVNTLGRWKQIVNQIPDEQPLLLHVLKGNYTVYVTI